MQSLMLYGKRRGKGDLRTARLLDWFFGEDKEEEEGIWVLGRGEGGVCSWNVLFLSWHLSIGSELVTYVIKFSLLSILQAASVRIVLHMCIY